MHYFNQHFNTGYVEVFCLFVSFYLVLLEKLLENLILVRELEMHIYWYNQCIKNRTYTRCKEEKESHSAHVEPRSGQIFQQDFEGEVGFFY